MVLQSCLSTRTAFQNVSLSLLSAKIRHSLNYNFLFVIYNLKEVYTLDVFDYARYAQLIKRLKNLHGVKLSYGKPILRKARSWESQQHSLQCQLGYGFQPLTPRRSVKHGLEEHLWMGVRVNWVGGRGDHL